MPSPADAPAYLSQLEQFGIKFGLDNIRAILRAWGSPELRFRSVHVAGTNGKGSVTAMVDASLRAAGYRTGRYTSPHLVRLAERFVIDGRQVTEEALIASTDALRAAVGRLLAEGTLQAPPTFFEATTAVAFDLFRRAEVDIAVCEVGLGGRLDATNVLEPVVAAITSIGLDHEPYLGRTLREIAGEKAGIIKPGTPVVVGKMASEALDEIEQAARDRRAEIVRAWDGTEAAGIVDPAAHVESMEPWPLRQRVRLSTAVRDYGELDLALVGAHQIDNAVVAVRLLESLNDVGLNVTAEAIASGLSTVEWPGRLERRRLPDGREALLDAAHNPDGAAALAAFLQCASDRRWPLVFAASRDKDIAGMLRALAPVTSVLVLTRASNPRAADPAFLATVAREAAPGLEVGIEPTPAGALAAAWNVSPHIVVAGSIFLLGEVVEVLP